MPASVPSLCPSAPIYIFRLRGWPLQFLARADFAGALMTFLAQPSFSIQPLCLPFHHLLPRASPLYQHINPRKKHPWSPSVSSSPVIDSHPTPHHMHHSLRLLSLNKEQTARPALCSPSPPSSPSRPSFSRQRREWQLGQHRR